MMIDQQPDKLERVGKCYHHGEVTMMMPVVTKMMPVVTMMMTVVTMMMTMMMTMWTMWVISKSL